MSSPVKCASNDQIVVRAELVQAAFLECSVEDQASGLVDDHESKHGPLRGELVDLQEMGST